MTPVWSLLLAISIGLGIVEWMISPNIPAPLLATDVAVGLTFCVAGLVASGGRRRVRIAILFEATGIAWLIGGLVPGLLDLYVGPLAHLLLAYPSGRTAGRSRRVLVLVGYLAAVFGQVPFVRAALPILLVVVAIVVVAAAIGPSSAGRRARAPSAAAAVAIAGAAIVFRWGTVLGSLDPDVGRSAYAFVLVTSAVFLAVQLRWGSWSRDAVARLVIDLGDASEPATLRRTLADALGDPSLVIGLAAGSGDDFVDEIGRSVAVPAPGNGRDVRALTVGTDQIGVLIRDDTTDVEDTLVDGVAAAAQLAITNARLHADAREKLRGLVASRRRIVDVADAERSRIRTELEEGTGRRLARAEALLSAHRDPGRPAEDAGDLVSEIRAIRSDLGQLTLGIGSSVLVARGLAAAVTPLIGRSSVPIELDIPPRRWPEVVERTAYFVCSEGLANAARHAHPSKIRIRVSEQAGFLDVEITDDGIGAADPAGGSGLRGLADRVEAIGGSVGVRDRRSGGTRLTARLPLHDSLGHR